MKKLTRRRPSAALIVAIIAVVLALAGTAVAAKKLGLSSLSKSAKAQTVGVGKLTYLNTHTSVISASGAGAFVSATCPGGTVPVGGGINVSNDTDSYVNDSYPTASGWAGNVFNGTANPNTVTVTAICATSPSITGTPG